MPTTSIVRTIEGEIISLSVLLDTAALKLEGDLIESIIGEVALLSTLARSPSSFLVLMMMKIFPHR
jgi:hypothetical protein